MTVSTEGDEAIRRAIRDGAGGDYCDVVDFVKKHYGVDVSTAQVERVVQELKRSPRGPGRIDLQMSGELEANSGPASLAIPAGTSPPAPVAEESSKSDRDAVLAFVERMGGFPSARQALDRVEQSLRRLMG